MTFGSRARFLVELRFLPYRELHTRTAVARNPCVSWSLLLTRTGDGGRRGRRRQRPHRVHFERGRSRQVRGECSVRGHHSVRVAGPRDSAEVQFPRGGRRRRDTGSIQLGAGRRRSTRR